MDGASRYRLACAGLVGPRTLPTRAVRLRLFRRFGLPARIRSDNGVPCAGPTALARLSVLAVWWIHLGMERIQLGCPGQNGRHERMHRTLKAETTRPRRPTAPRNSGGLARFSASTTSHVRMRRWGGLPPAMAYVPSDRPMPDHLPAVEYPAHFERRRVSSSGTIKWRNLRVTVSSVLAREDIGCEEIADGEWALY
ncbi:hypothetical protein BH18ACI5_BH18ACI5_17520 [soil metagenome]